jgi:C-terminal processing protease CtpA/Prc
VRARYAACITLAVVVGGPVHAQDSRSNDSRVQIERLVALGRVWGAAKFFHPALAYRPVSDWDDALVSAIPKVRHARTADEFRDAVQAMLDVLNDPMTTVTFTTSAAGAGSAPDRQLAFRWTDDRILIVTAGNYYALYGARASEMLRQIADSVPVARAVVFDLRSSGDIDAYGKAALSGSFGEIERRLTRDTLQTTRERRRVYYGYDSPNTSGQYRGGFFVPFGMPITPSATARETPSVFLLNESATVLPATIPLQAAGKALIVYEGDLRRQSAGDVSNVTLSDGLTARVRQSEPIFPDGTSGALQPDEIIPTANIGAGDLALNRAVALARVFHSSRVTRGKVPTTVSLLRDRSYPQMRYPELEYRLLAAFRFWNVIEYFYPYKDLLDKRWETVLPELIPLFESAMNAREYAQAVAVMSTKLQDSHAYVAGQTFNDEVIATGLPPIRVRMIQDSLIVTALFDTAAARAAGVQVGDVVVRIDGVDAMTLYRETGAHISVSTAQSGREKATLQFMHGQPGSKATIILRSRNGRMKQAVLERRYEDYSTLYHRERRGEIVRILPGNIGYVDLDRLSVDMVDSMFQVLAHTNAIIFDMRGYPNGTIYSMAPWFTDSARVVALLGTPMVGHGSPAEHSTEVFAQTVQPAASRLRYTGRTVMLIDERTMSQAELTGMYMKTLNGTTFVGSRSAGANGEITTVALPGGMTVGFTGQSVTFPDGARLQRLGLKPDIAVPPTINGIRAGRDEQLEAAIRLLSVRRPH